MVTPWPAGLSFIASPFNVTDEGPQDAVLRTQMQAGAAKTRPLFTAAPEPYSGVTDQMSSADVDILIAFYKTTLSMGSLPFEVNHPRTGVLTVFRFLSPYKIQYIITDEYRVTLDLEVLP